MADNKISYDSIGFGYNTTRRADYYISKKLLELLSPNYNSSYLDIGCGTGNYTIELASNGFDFHGVEPSHLMLDQAKSRNNKINWVLGSAESIPFSDNFFAGCIATLTIHHWNDIKRSFTELNRVLKPNSLIVIFTSVPEQMKNYWLNYCFPNILSESIAKMPTYAKITNEANYSGFEVIYEENYFIQDDLKDLFLYSGKNKPEIYFNQTIRDGISSFAALANKHEVELGLANLLKDLKSGDFKEVSSRFNMKMGDYLFMVLKSGSKLSSTAT